VYRQRRYPGDSLHDHETPSRSDSHDTRLTFFANRLTNVLSSKTMVEHANNGRRHYAVVDGRRVPLDYDAARRIAQQAHLPALGDPKRAAEIVAEAERAERERLTA
jgi:hypothetical protein